MNGSSVRRAAGPLLVLGIAVAIGFMALAAWWFNRGAGGTDASLQFGALMNSGRSYYDKGETSRAIDAFTSGLFSSPSRFSSMGTIAAFMYFDERSSSTAFTFSLVFFAPAIFTFMPQTGSMATSGGEAGATVCSAWPEQHE